MDLQKQGSMGFENNSVSTKSFGLKDKVGACFHVNEDPVTLAKMIMDDIEAKRSHFEELYQENVLNKRLAEITAE